MSGYVTSARISGPAPRLVRRAPDHEEPDPNSVSLAPDLEPLVVSDRIDGIDGLSERWSAARERWTQLTFYLFDPNAWR